MEDRIKKELRRQLVHASGVMLVPLAFIFGKFFIGAASLVIALMIFILAEHGKNNNMETNRYDSNSKSKRYANEGSNRSAVKSVPGKPNRIGFHSTLNTIHIVFQKFERSGANYRGAFYFYLASAVSLFLFPLQIAALSITVLALGDSLSTAAGIFGSHKIFYNRKKTWEGTLAGFAAAFAGCLLISPQLALPAALTGMIVESLPLKIDDNLTIPILTGIALSAVAVFF